jgi:hypothetical protein
MQPLKTEGLKRWIRLAMSGFSASIVLAFAGAALAYFGSEMLWPIPIADASESPLVFDSPSRTIALFQPAENKASNALQVGLRGGEVILLSDWRFTDDAGLGDDKNKVGDKDKGKGPPPGKGPFPSGGG